VTLLEQLCYLLYNITNTATVHMQTQTYVVLNLLFDRGRRTYISRVKSQSLNNVVITVLNSLRNTILLLLL